MTSNPKSKRLFKKNHVIAPLHTYGPAALSPDGSKLLTCVAEEVILTDVSTALEICRLAGDTQPITSFCITPSGAYVTVFTATPSLRIFTLTTDPSPSKLLQPIRVISRPHEAPILVCKADPTSNYVASGSADGVVKVWDVVHGQLTHIFKGHGGAISALAFNFPDSTHVARSGVKQLITASADTQIRIFDLTKSGGGGDSSHPCRVLSGHTSLPRGLDVTDDGSTLVSGGRDGMVMVWNLHAEDPLESKQNKKKKKKEQDSTPLLSLTIPVMDCVEALGLLKRPSGDVTSNDNGTLQFFTAGQKGVINVWDGKKGKLLFSLDNQNSNEITDANYAPATMTIMSVHTDRNISLHSISTRRVTRQFIGFNDEIVDAVFLTRSSEAATGSETDIALATNSPLIRVYSTQGDNVRLLEGHAGIVLCLDTSADRRILVSGSKDRSARIWTLDEAENPEWRCVASCEGHAASVGAVAVSRNVDESRVSQRRFMFTGGQDNTIRMWDLSVIPLSHDDATVPIKCKTLTTQIAHTKDVNSLDVSPDDRLLASGSQDHTAKLYKIDYNNKQATGDLIPLGIFKGHKRGVWSVKFNKGEKVLVTGSGDKTVKLWDLDNFSCLHTFQGHTNAVLRVDFINSTKQVISAAADGLVKLWSIGGGQDAVTLDNHEDKVWALAISSDEQTIVSAAADSVVTFWKDCTKEEELENDAKRSALSLKEQDFANFLAIHDYIKAAQLAIAMNKPDKLKSIFTRVKSLRMSAEAESLPSISLFTADEIIKALSRSEITQLVQYIRVWNTTSAMSMLAQELLGAIYRLYSVDTLIYIFNESGGENTGVKSQPRSNGAVAETDAGGLKGTISELVPYTERHLSQLDRHVRESYALDFMLGEIA